MAATALIQVTRQTDTPLKERHPRLNFESCTKAEGCVKIKAAVTLDATYRKFYSKQDPSKPCFADGSWDPELCPDEEACLKNCQTDGISDYSEVAGITTKDGSSINLKLVIENKETKEIGIGSRIYLLDDNGRYVIHKLKGKEISVDVDVSRLGCGVNGQFYLTEMSEDGGSKNQTFMNTDQLGSFSGTGYCSSACPADLAFIGTELNYELKRKGATPKGSCCNHMSLIGSNPFAQVMTAHSCDASGPKICTGKKCEQGPEGICDKNGCEFNPYRLGSTEFYGPGKAVDSKLPFKVVTQFITDSKGELSEVRRLYVQGGKVIKNAHSGYPELKSFNSITNDFCSKSVEVFGGPDKFTDMGGLKHLSDSLDRGMVLVMSLWDDKGDTNMLWFDGAFPPDVDPKKPGVTRGPCTRANSNVTEFEAQNPEAFVQFSNIRVGELDSTYT
ncbi:family 7 glycoside hydrolase [Melampsora americana]|nr:family 7 glycoside hydrolase [Melampsora americana]